MENTSPYRWKKEEFKKEAPSRFSTLMKEKKRSVTTSVRRRRTSQKKRPGGESMPTFYKYKLIDYGKGELKGGSLRQLF